MAKYVFKPYDPIFGELFEKEKERLRGVIKNYKSIEHVGSTAVPGLGGKGIIDIAIIVVAKSMEMVSTAIQEVGYVYSEGASTKERYFFHCDLTDTKEGIRRYHVHLMPENTKDCVFMLKFRDFLRLHPSWVKKYSNIKRRAAALSNEDGAVYREMKKPMIEKIIGEIENEEKCKNIKELF